MTEIGVSRRGRIRAISKSEVRFAQSVEPDTRVDAIKSRIDRETTALQGALTKAGFDPEKFEGNVVFDSIVGYEADSFVRGEQLERVTITVTLIEKEVKA